MATSQNLLDEYLDTVCAHVNSHYDHQSIREELRDHIEDMSDIYGSDKVLQYMGDPKDIGDDFNDIYNVHEARLYRFSKWILCTLVVILSLNVGVGFIASRNSKDPFQFVSNENNKAYAYKQNKVKFGGNRYEWATSYYSQEGLKLFIRVEESMVSKNPKVNMSKLMINNKEIPLSHDMVYLDYNGYVINVDDLYEEVTEVQINLNDKTLYAKRKGTAKS